MFDLEMRAAEESGNLLGFVKMDDHSTENKGHSDLPNYAKPPKCSKMI